MSMEDYWEEQNEYNDRLGARYTVSYVGYLFYGDSDGLNEFSTNDWHQCNELINAYGDMIHVYDNYYGVSFDNGEWN